MHILMVSEYFSPHAMGGGELSAFALAKALVRRNVKVSVLTSAFPGDAAQDVMDGVTIYRRTRTGSAQSIAANVRRYCYTRSVEQELPRLVAEIRPDVLHALNITSMPGVARVARMRGIPAIAHINSPLAFDPKGTLLDGGKEATRPYTFWRFVGSLLTARELGRRANAWHLRWNPAAWVLIYHRWARIRDSFPSFRHFFPISSAMRRWLERYGVPRDKTTVLPNIIDARALLRIRPAERRIPIILYLGGYARMKGLHVVLDALQGVREPYELRCYGRGEERARLQEQARLAGVHAAFQDEAADIASVMDADIIVFPSLVPEGLGRVALEGMAAGKPVIASDIGGLRDVVVDTITGSLVKPGVTSDWKTAIIALVRDPAKRKKLGRAGRKRFLSAFTEEAIIRKALRSYRQVLA